MCRRPIILDCLTLVLFQTVVSCCFKTKPTRIHIHLVCTQFNDFGYQSKFCKHLLTNWYKMTKLDWTHVTESETIIMHLLSLSMDRKSHLLKFHLKIFGYLKRHYWKIGLRRSIYSERERETEREIFQTRRWKKIKSFKNTNLSQSMEIPKFRCRKEVCFAFVLRDCPMLSVSQWYLPWIHDKS